MGVGAGHGRLPAVVVWRLLRWPEFWPHAPWISTDSAPDFAAPSHQPQAGRDHTRQKESGDRRLHFTGSKQKHAGEHRREHRSAASTDAVPAGLRSHATDCSRESSAARLSPCRADRRAHSVRRRACHARRRARYAQSARLQPQPSRGEPARRAKPPSAAATGSDESPCAYFNEPSGAD